MMIPDCSRSSQEDKLGADNLQGEEEPMSPTSASCGIARRISIGPSVSTSSRRAMGLMRRPRNSNTTGVIKTIYATWYKTGDNQASPTSQDHQTRPHDGDYKQVVRTSRLLVRAGREPCLKIAEKVAQSAKVAQPKISRT
jgi:hypothetical protein